MVNESGSSKNGLKDLTWEAPLISSHLTSLVNSWLGIGLNQWFKSKSCVSFEVSWFLLCSNDGGNWVNQILGPCFCFNMKNFFFSHVWKISSESKILWIIFLAIKTHGWRWSKNRETYTDISCRYYGLVLNHHNKANITTKWIL